jgi:hypothetical protein
MCEPILLEKNTMSYLVIGAGTNSFLLPVVEFSEAVARRGLSARFPEARLRIAEADEDREFLESRFGKSYSIFILANEGAVDLAGIVGFEFSRIGVPVGTIQNDEVGETSPL